MKLEVCMCVWHMCASDSNVVTGTLLLPSGLLQYNWRAVAVL